jgi:hypothetical protein
MTDKLDQAIAAAAMPERLAVQITLSTRRVVVVDVPVDVSQGEILELVGWLASTLEGHIAASLSTSIAVPRRGIIVPS